MQGNRLHSLLIPCVAFLGCSCLALPPHAIPTSISLFLSCWRKALRLLFLFGSGEVLPVLCFSLIQAIKYKAENFNHPSHQTNISSLEPFSHVLLFPLVSLWFLHAKLSPILVHLHRKTILLFPLSNPSSPSLP